MRDACVEGAGVLVFVERNVRTWSFCDVAADPRTVYALSAKAEALCIIGTLLLLHLAEEGPTTACQVLPEQLDRVLLHPG